MRRRRFLKLVGLSSLGAMLQVSLGSGSALGASRVASLNGRLYRGDGRGRIFVSQTNGASWELHTYLGPRYRVTRMAIDGRSRVRATIAYGGRSFRLVLAPDAQRWLTAS